MKRPLLVALLTIATGVGGCGTVSDEKHDPTIAEAILQLTRAVDETLRTSDVQGGRRGERRPWPCDLEGHHAVSYSYDVDSTNPEAVVKRALAYWTARGVRVVDDSSGRSIHPSVTLAGELFELGIYAFPERGQVWIAGNTVCLAGEVPEGWRDVR
ncbi:hypothetical protein [Microtetraspora niveoalba]|uniref:hypothetical protein n=1 Tax=Microtetraspora niveoalba TaxID=46175 RepID=UPI0012FAE81A|nr:hypothetical protein [Microtetraspora niveoalba]